MRCSSARLLIPAGTFGIPTMCQDLPGMAGKRVVQTQQLRIRDPLRGQCWRLPHEAPRLQPRTVRRSARDPASSCGVCEGPCCHTPSRGCGGTAQAPFYRTCSFCAPEHLPQLPKGPQPTPWLPSGGAGSCSLHTLKSYWDHPVNGDQSEIPIGTPGPAPNCLGPVLG